MSIAFRPVWQRAAFLLVFFAFLTTLYLRVGDAPPPVAAVPNDPDTYWSLGVADDSGDEFAAGSAADVRYEVGKSAPRSDWRQRQEAGDASPPVYRIVFPLDGAPAATPVLALDYSFTGIAPRWVELLVNGKRGRFRVRPVAARNLDERQSNSILHSRQALRVPLDPSMLRAGANELGISFSGEGGSVTYDALALRRSGGDGSGLEATVEPTIFYVRRGEQIRELVEVVVRHRRPVGAAAASLEADGVAAAAKSEAAFDFGEQIIEVAVPVTQGPTPYRLKVTAGGETKNFEGRFQPEKRWRIFAGLKIHNDIGYTDLQPHVQELDGRNIDGLLEIMRRYPFYRFNLETGWLVENYLRSRGPERVRELLAHASTGRVGVSALYLNLMTGMATGEEMYRAMYFSHSLSKKHNVPMRFACLTDAPSHTWSTPSVLADAGVRGFALGSNQTRAPLLQNSSLNEDSPFYWESIDGRRVLAWFARSYLQFHRLIGDQPSLDRLRRTVPQFLARYRREGYPVDAVLLYGLYTDNAAIEKGEAEILKEWNQAFAFPTIQPATDDDYFAYLSTHFSEKLPVFRGDGGAYWEDGAGSTAAETALNRDSQRLLPAAETAAALATAFQPAELYPADEFREAWKNLMFYDEHTWGASRSISQPERRLVTDQWDLKRAYAHRAHWAAKDLLYRSLNRLVQNISVDGPTLFVFNTAAETRSGRVEFEIDPRREIVDPETGRPVDAEVVAAKDGYQVRRFLAEEVPGFGYRAYGVRLADRAAAPAQSNVSGGWQIESRHYRIRVDPATGGIAELIDKELGRDLADASAPWRLNQLLYVAGGEGSRILQDLLTLQPPKLEISASRDARLISNSRRRMVVRAQAKNVPAIETEITLDDAVKQVDIVNRIRKDEVRSKEAVYFAFPFRVSPPELLYEVQNAWVRPNTDQLPGAGREWFTTQNVAVARDGGVSIALGTPDTPFVTLTDINRGAWPKTLEIRNGHIYSYVMNNYWFTNYKASQGGDFTFRYSISSGRPMSERELAKFASQIASPLVAYDYYETGNVRIREAKRRMPMARGQFLKIDGDAQVTAFKQAEDGAGFMLRLRETAGRRGVARLVSPVLALSAASITNGVEDPVKTLPVANGVVEIPLEPRRFTTVRLTLGR